jgi:isoleucyl-tRNA synthetase
VDYQGDIPTSPKTIQEFGDKYRKIRNTLRYLLSNLYDFDPKKDAQPIPQRSLDAWAMDQVDTLIKETVEAYDTYQTHRAFRLLHDFCAVQISAMYGNAMKDRLYCESPDSPLRRRCQTVMYKMVKVLTKLLAPMLVFTADEAWEHIQHKPQGEENLPSVHLASLPKPTGLQISDEVRAEWKLLFDLREKTLLQLDAIKKAAGMNKALDAEAVYEVADAGLLARLKEYGVDLEDIVGCGYHSIVAGAETKVTAVDRRDKYQACARSWKRRPDVGSVAAYPDLCARDAAAIRS